MRNWYLNAAATADAFIAPYGSFLTRPAFDAAEAAGVPCLTPSAGDPNLWSAGRRWCVGLLEPSTDFFIGALRLAAAAAPGTVALLQRDDPYSSLTMDGAEAAAAVLGLAPVARRRFTSQDERTAAAQATHEHIVLGIGYQPGTSGDGFFEDAAALVELLRPARSRLLVLGVAAAAPDFMRSIGDAAEGIVGVTGWRSYLPTLGNAGFASAYHRRWGTAPNAHAAQGYAAGEVLGQAAQAAGKPTHGSQTAAARRERLRDALFTLDTSTVFGRYRVAGSGLQIGHEPALVQWRHGRLHGLDPSRLNDLAPWAPGSFKEAE